MKNLIQYLTIVMTIFTLSSLTGFGQNTAGVEGNWLGTLEFNGVKLRLVLKVTKTADGRLAATLDSLDQGARDLPIDEISQKDAAVSFSAAKLGLSYQGTLNEKADEMSGTFKQGAGAVPLVFRRTAEIPTISRPQEPQKPYPYKEEEVSYKNPADNVTLAGTLTLPLAGSGFPAVILITGSGAQDRNETVAGHRPFLVLADYLTRRGIAVLRVDDRGIGGSSAGTANATSENYAGDVLAGVEFLKSRKEINPKRIGLVGHSEGGMIAPLAAVRSKDVAFIVLLAGLGQTGEDVIYTQTELLQKAGGSSPETTAQTVALLKKIIAVLKSEPDNKRAESLIRETLEKEKSALNDEQRKAFAPTEATVKAQIPMYLSAWFRYFVAFDPRPTLKKVKVPVLALNGENDLQVSSKENLSFIAAALKSGGNKNYTIKSFPRLNHLFQTSQSGSPGEYNEIEETIAPIVLETVADWIIKRAAAK